MESHSYISPKNKNYKSFFSYKDDVFFEVQKNINKKLIGIPIYKKFNISKTEVIISPFIKALKSGINLMFYYHDIFIYHQIVHEQINTLSEIRELEYEFEIRWNEFISQLKYNNDMLYAYDMFKKAINRRLEDLK